MLPDAEQGIVNTSVTGTRWCFLFVQRLNFKHGKFTLRCLTNDSKATQNSNIKELVSVQLPKKTGEDLCPVTKPTIEKAAPYNRKKSTTITTTPDYSSTEKANIAENLSDFVPKISQRKEDNEYKDSREASLDTYLTWKPTVGNWTTFGLHVEIPFTDITFMKILAAEISLIIILVLSLHYYLLIAENDGNYDVQQTIYDDDLTLLTSSTMIYSHLQEVRLKTQILI
ncbi:hypothetical protein NPIL_70551 [Nephila pilipes]|uniref:Uncharacterized protein n=1 Tax=Nephila pilipes TaxID=299642 RepID=A0A8X6PXG2_NEPPI|nr:hypothetical protein NPIL_70551 [Nephila pilipes]